MSQTLRVHVRADVWSMKPWPRTYDASLLMLTRDDKGELMLTFVANRMTQVVKYADVLKVEVA